MGRRRLVVGGALGLLALVSGCWQPSGHLKVGTPTAPDPRSVQWRPPYGAGAPSARPPGGVRPARPTGGVLAVDATQVLHAASPFVNGICRNHSARQFEKAHVDRAAVLALARTVSPRWGASYVDQLRREGYAVDPERRGLYRTGHGPTDGRSSYDSMRGYFFNQSWNTDGQALTWDGYPYDDVRYPLAEASAMDASTLLTVNFGTDTAANAGALARYVNSPLDLLRRLYPLEAAPFNVNAARAGSFLFEIGNELALPDTRGHDKALSIGAYVANAKPYIDAIRQAQPQPVKIALAAALNVYWGGPNDKRKGQAWEQREQMVAAFLREAQAQGVRIDALQYHGYPTYPVSEPLAGPAYAEALIRDKLMPVLATAPNFVEIWDDEFHAAADERRNTGLYGALYAADTAATAFRLSLNGRQVMPVTADFALWHAGRGNNYDSLYFQNNDPSQVTPVYHFRRLLAENWGDWVLSTRTSGTGYWEDKAKNGEVTRVGNIDAVASRSTDGATLYVLVINRSADADEALTLELAGFSPRGGAAELKRIDAPGRNWDAAWNEVRIDERASVDLAGPVLFPAASISFLVIR